MLTRRAVLSGTAAASVAAIASAHGVATAAPAAAVGADLGCGFGTLDGGALASFHKEDVGFQVFMKWADNRAADVFYKEMGDGTVDVFFKFFIKGWSDVSTISLSRPATLSGAEASFAKVAADGASFFIKMNDTSVLTTFVSSEKGVQISVNEIGTDDGQIG